MSPAREAVITQALSKSRGNVIIRTKHMTQTARVNKASSGREELVRSYSRPATSTWRIVPPRETKDVANHHILVHVIDEQRTGRKYEMAAYFIIENG